MAIVVTGTSRSRVVDMGASERRRGSLAITGLADGANTIPHGLPFTPSRLSLRPSALGLWGETSAPSSSSIFITVGTSGAHDGTIDYEE